MNLDVSIIIVSYNTVDLLRQCITSIQKHVQSCKYEVVVVDNDSKDGSIEMVQKEFPDVRLIATGENLGFGKANNVGVEAANGEFVFLFNSDALLLEDTISPLIEYMRKDRSLGVVGPRVLLRDGKDQPKTWGYLPSLRRLFNQSSLLCRLFPNAKAFAGIYVEAVWQREMEAGWISGVCMMIPRKAFSEVGGFSPEFFMYAEDVDLCRRLVEAGYRAVRIHDYAIQHLCGGSSKTEQQVLKYRVMQQRNFLILCDKSMQGVQAYAVRIILIMGLALRTCLQVPSALKNKTGQREFKTSLICLKDLLGMLKKLPGESYA